MVHLHWYIENRVAVLRGKKGEYTPWTPYKFAGTVFRENDAVEIVGLCGDELDPESMKDLLSQFYALSVKKVLFSRFKNGKLVEREYELERIKHLFK